ncbi:MAG: presenilin family intramembrane aspartyl protease [Candidatus Diapherotrites archaeon]|nr:presenilin family intramembrane aspartyl protease [Candidatus Diapherotrites archaeon]
MNSKLIAELVIVFLIVQSLGLYVASSLVAQDVHATIVSDNPDDIANTAGLLLYILSFTVILLLVIKFFKAKTSYLVLKAFETLAIFGSSVIVFSIFFGDAFGLALALLLVALRIGVSKNIWIRNIASMIAVVGAGSLIGVSLGIIPIILFIVALIIYDYIAVFKTKHMVSIAKAVVDKNLAFTIALPTKEHKFELGTGDLVIPLVFASASVQNSGMIAGIFVLAGSLAGLLLTIDYSSKHVGKALPAIPLQGIFMIAAFGVAKVLGF